MRTAKSRKSFFFFFNSIFNKQNNKEVSNRLVYVHQVEIIRHDATASMRLYIFFFSNRIKYPNVSNHKTSHNRNWMAEIKKREQINVSIKIIVMSSIQIGSEQNGTDDSIALVCIANEIVVK